MTGNKKSLLTRSAGPTTNGLTLQQRVRTYSDGLKYLCMAERNRSVAGTELNDASSRSHVFYELTLDQGAGEVTSVFTILDVAGREGHQTRAGIKPVDSQRETNAIRAVNDEIDCVLENYPTRVSKKSLKSPVSSWQDY